VGREIDVDRAAKTLGAGPAPPAAEGRPPYLQFARPPVRCALQWPPIDVDGVRTNAEAVVVAYEFGAAVVVFTAPATGTLGDLARLGAKLCATDALARAARSLVDEIVRKLGDAIEAPLVPDVVEEYLVFHAREVETEVPVALWTTTFAAGLAAVLRAELRPLSSQEIEHTLAAPASFTPDDLVMVDWNAAFVARERADDVLAVLAFANVQLLEMRFLDARLDDDLQRSYDVVRGVRPRIVLLPSEHRGALDQVARRQIDAALLFEHVRNAPKLLGDQYLARVYENAARRFRLADWNDAIHRKLEVLGTIYERLRDRAAVARAEVLEWVVIVLIVVSMVIPFLVPLP
jgi:hypothetical protein